MSVTMPTQKEILKSSINDAATISVINRFDLPSDAVDQYMKRRFDEIERNKAFLDSTEFKQYEGAIRASLNGKPGYISSNLPISVDALNRMCRAIDEAPNTMTLHDPDHEFVTLTMYNGIVYETRPMSQHCYLHVVGDADDINSTRNEIFSAIEHHVYQLPTLVGMTQNEFVDKHNTMHFNKAELVELFSKTLDNLLTVED